MRPLHNDLLSSVDWSNLNCLDCFVLGCSEAYNLSRYPQWDALNSQAAEQANSCLKYVKGSLSYMNQKNFMRHCQFFIWFRNLQRRKQLNS